MSNSNPKAWLVGIAAVVLICAAGFYVIRPSFKPPTTPSVEVGQAVADKFLTSIRSGKAGDAWDMATAEFKSIEGRESFIRKAKSTPLLTSSLQFNSSQSVTVHDEPRSEYLFQSPSAKLVRVLVGYERGEWKVDRLAF